METNIQKFELSQNGKNYILTTGVKGIFVKLTCIEAGVAQPLIYIGEFSLAYLQTLSKIFDTISTVIQAQEILNHSIETQKVSIENQGDVINITLYLARETESEENYEVKIGGGNNIQKNITYNKPEEYTSTEEFAKTIYTQGQTLPSKNINITPVGGTTTTTTQETYTTTTDNYQDYKNQNYENYNYQNYDNGNLNVNTVTTTTTTDTNVYNTGVPLEQPITLELNSNEGKDIDINQFLNNLQTQTQTETTYTIPTEQITTTNVTTTETPYIDTNQYTTTQETTSTTYIPTEQITTTNITTETPYIDTNQYTTTQETTETQYIQNEPITTGLTTTETQYIPNEQYTTTEQTTTETTYIPTDHISPPITKIETPYIQNQQYTTHETTKTTSYIPPPQPKISYEPPKREQIQYSAPAEKITYSTNIPSTNQDMFHKTIETTKKTTTKHYNPPMQIPNVDMSIYNERVTQLQTETNKIKSEYEILKNEANKLSREVGQLRGQISILLEENKILREKNGSNPSEIQIHEISILKQENEKLKRELEKYLTLETTFEQYKRLKEEEIKYFKLQIEEYKKNQKKLEEILLLKQREIDELKLEIQRLLKNVSISQSQNYMMRQQQKLNAGSMNKQMLTIQDTRMEVVKGDIIRTTAELEFLTRKICQDHQKVTLDLIYKATLDTDKASAFHNKCDDARGTLVLVKSGNGKRFGGYTTCNWKGNSIEKKDDKAFVFSLDKMQAYDIIQGEDAIGCYPKYGPVFLGCQIRIYDEFFTNGGTTFEKGMNYNTQEDYELSGGLKQFEVKEIEVYGIELE